MKQTVRVLSTVLARNHLKSKARDGSSKSRRNSAASLLVNQRVEEFENLACSVIGMDGPHPGKQVAEMDYLIGSSI